MRRAAWLETVRQDLRFAVRVLRRSPGFTATAVILLALGIGVNTAIFSVISSVFLRPMPFPEPDRLVLLWEDFSASGGPTRTEASPADYAEWKARNRSLADIAVMIGTTYNLTGSFANYGVNQDHRFNLSFTLAGVGTFSNLFGAFGGQNR